MLSSDEIRILRELRSSDGGCIPETPLEREVCAALDTRGLVYQGRQFFHINSSGLRELEAWEAEQP